MLKPNEIPEITFSFIEKERRNLLILSSLVLLLSFFNVPDDSEIAIFGVKLSLRENIVVLYVSGLSLLAYYFYLFSVLTKTYKKDIKARITSYAKLKMMHHVSQCLQDNGVTDDALKIDVKSIPGGKGSTYSAALDHVLNYHLKFDISEGKSEKFKGVKLINWRQKEVLKAKSLGFKILGTLASKNSWFYNFPFYYCAAAIIALLLFLAGNYLEKTIPRTACVSGSCYGDIEVSRLISVYDGDTFKVSLDHVHPIIGQKISVRIAGVNTPELRGKCEQEKVKALEAKSVTVDVLESAKKITLKNIQRGKYFRIVAEVEADGRNLGEILLKKNLANEYDGKVKKKSWCPQNSTPVGPVKEVVPKGA